MNEPMPRSRKMEPPADISWIKFETIGPPRWLVVLFVVTLILAAAVVAAAIALWMFQ